MHLRKFLARIGCVALSAMSAPTHAQSRIDDLVVRNGMVVPEVVYGAPDANPTLRSLGRWRDASRDQDYTIWEIANPTKNPARLRLEAMQDAFTVEIDVPGYRRAYLRSPVVAGTAEHRLLVNQKVLAVIAAGTADWSDGSVVAPGPGANRAPIWYSNAPDIAQLAPSYRYAPIVFDPDNEPVGFSTPQAPAGLTWVEDSGRYDWDAATAQLGTTTVVLRATDPRGASANQSATIKLVADFCPIYPISLPASALSGIPIGQHFDKLPRGSGSGNYQWLTWTGPVDSNTLAQGLNPPGNSETYVDPDEPGDHQLDIADWAQGASGSMNADNVKTRLNALLGRDITVPAYDQIRQTGSRFDYRTQRFVVVRLTDYSLTGNGWLSFDYRGEMRCYNDMPSAGPQSLATPEDTVLPIVLAGTDPESDVLAYTVLTQPAHGALSGTAPNLAYTPAGNFFGPDAFTFQVRDGEFVSSVATVSIAVTPVDDAPAAHDIDLSTFEETPVAVTLSGTDIDSASLGFEVVASPSHGTISGLGADRTYTPAPDFFGMDSFTYRASDGEADSNLATVMITVTPVNDAPAVADIAGGTPEDTALSVTLVATDADGDALTYRVISQPVHGGLSGSAPNLTYQPASDFNGTDSFTFLANDGQADSAPATFVVTVSPVNDDPVITSQPVTDGAIDVAYSYQATATDPDGDSLSYALDRAPQGMAVDAGGLVLWTPGAQQGGVGHVVLTVQDGHGGSATQAFDLFVTNSNAGPHFVSTPTSTVSEGAGLSYDSDATDPDAGDTLRYGLDQGPAGATINPVTGVVTWSPPAGITDGVRHDNAMCRRPSAVTGAFAPKIKWQWTGASGIAHPLVAPIRDTDGNGRIDVSDDPYVVANTYHPSGDCFPSFVVAINGKTGQELWRQSGPGGFVSGAPIAIGDLDGDGTPEVIGKRMSGGLIAINANGTLKWTTNTVPPSVECHGLSPITLADLDGDGKSEILHRGYVFNFDGSLRLGLSLNQQQNSGFSATAVDVAVDLDLDGKQEILANYTARRLDGTVVWTFPFAAQSFAVLNANADPYPEVLYNVNGRVELLDHDGNRIWLRNFPVVPGGSFSAADLDGDGVLEVFGLNSNRLRVLRATDGVEVWSASVQDGSSSTVATAFDLEGDGTMEVIYRDEQNLRIFDGHTGEVRHTLVLGSATRNEGPIVADVDSDGHAEIVLPGDLGFTVIEDSNDAWQATRAIWNQFAYSIDSINDDLSVPKAAPQPWLAHNSYRVNATIPKAFGLADLAVFGLALDQSAGAPRLVAEVRSRGITGSTGPTTLTFYSGDPDAGGMPLGSVGVAALAAGSSQVVVLDDVQIDTTGSLLYARVDTANAIAECDESNNTGAAGYFAARVSDTEGLFDLQRFTVNVSNVNQPPVLANQTLANAFERKFYKATVAASDPDRGDGLRFRIVSGPAGMTIDQVSGELRWTPLSATSPVSATIQVTDLAGLSATGTVSLAVIPNTPPQITSTPIFSVASFEPYRYDVNASDADGDTLVYALTQWAGNMTINPTTGLIQWTANFDIQYNTIIVTVSDGRGGVAVQTYTLGVTHYDFNLPPSFTSTPVLKAVAGRAYAYDANGVDPNGDPLAFSLYTKPAGMTIVPASGVVAWTPTINQVGSHPVVVNLNDGRSGTATQSFILVVSANQGPQITTSPLDTGKVAREYRYDVDATDGNGDSIAYSLSAAPSGMVIDAVTGLIRWTPATPGPASVIVRASDGLAYQEQSWSLTILDGSIPLAVNLVLAPTTVAPDAPVTATLAVSGAAGLPVATSTLDGAPVALPANGTATMSAHAIGRHTVSTAVTDGFDTVTASADFFVSDGSDTSAPEVHLTAPGDNAEITKPTAVRGSVQDPNLASWLLAYRDSNSPDGALTTLAQGTANVPESALATFDPTTLLNGQYSIILQATDASGNTAFDSVVVRVTDDMKVGNYSITFEDVNIPLSGIPIRVTRTYDTRQRNQALDFGYGWSVDYQNVRVRESQAPGYSWQLVTTNQGGFQTHCVQPNGDRVVTVTLPDGKVESFRARGDQNCAQFQIPELVFLTFEPIDGTDSALEQTDYGPLRVTEVAGSGVSHLVDADNPGMPVDPRHYRLTTPEGVIYDLDQFFGIRKVTEPSGNTLSYSSDGIVHSSGVGVQFVRDPATNRITEIVLPDGKVLSYGYTPAGDLDLMADQLLQTTRYAYEPRAATNPRFKHYLRDIIDARGVRVSRNEYIDEQGCTTNPADPCDPTRALRLWKTIDADGNEIVYTHDITGQVEQVRDRRGFLKTYEYDDSGRVLSETNALNETTLHSYDADGNELTRTDPLGHTTASAYDVRGNKVAEVGPTGQRTEMEYDGRNALTVQRECLDPVAIPVAGVGATTPSAPCANHRPTIRNTYRPETGALTITKDALGHETRFTYDSGSGSGQTGELTDTYDALNHRTHYGIDYRGWRTSETNALGHVTTYTHDDNGRIRTETRTRTVYPVGAIPGANGTVQTLVTTTTYDDKGRATRTDHADGSFTTVHYNAIDKPELECDALNHCTRHDYDAQGREWKTTYADGSFETKAYDAEGNVTAQTDRGGRSTKMVYDAAGRLTETILPDAGSNDGNDANNPRTISVYDDSGRLVASSDPNGHTTTYGYDDAGRRTTVTDARNHVTTTHYDSTGRRSNTVDALGRITTFVHDDAGRVISTVFDDQSTTWMTFDAIGRKVAETDQEGRITRYDYDALGRLVAVFLPDPATGSNPPLVNGNSPDPNVLVTRYGYDESGNKLSQTDAEGRTTTWTHDEAGRERSRTLPLGQTETFGYDVVGNRDTHADFNGRTTTYAYDELNRLATTTFPDGEGTRTIGYTPSGQRDHVTDQSGTTSYRYDGRDRLARVTDANGRTIEYEYDAAGNRTAVITASQSHAYDYDDLNRLETVTSTVGTEAATVTRYEYDDVGNRKAMVHGNGTRTEYGYSRLNRLKTLVHRTAAGALLLGLGYTLDASGMRTAIDETDAQTGTRNTTYQYDEVKRLTGETVIASDAASNRSTTWVYDRVGNRLTQTHTAGAAPAGITTYGYDANDRLHSESGAATSAYVYDPNGNTLSRTVSGASITYRYTSENRLAESSTGNVTVTYRYNADGLRTRKIEAAPGGTSTTDYLVDPNQSYAQVVEEWRGSDAGAPVLVAAYALGDERLSQTRCAANTQGTPIGECQGAEVSHFHADGLGSVRLLSDGIGAITDRYAYEAFGELDEAASSGGTSNEFSYTGEQFDPSLGFYYLRARNYDPSSGRFTQQDSYLGRSSDPGSLQKYLYANADPVNGRDPSGHLTLIEVGNAIGVGTILVSAAITTSAWVTAAYASDSINARTRARATTLACAASLAGTTVNGPVCGNTPIPILFSQVQQTPGIADHILQSQFSGRPRLLRRTSIPIINAGNRAIAYSKCALGIDKISPDLGSSCDEYPFASTIEGGGYATVRNVSLTEQFVQGGEISSFYTYCNVSGYAPVFNEFVVIPVVRSHRTFQCGVFR